MAEIRPYTPDDYDQLAAVLHECGLYFEGSDNREAINEKVRRDPESIIVAELGGLVVGTTRIQEDGSMGLIWRTGVLEEYRRQGIGGQLSDRAKDILRERGCVQANILVEEDDPAMQEHWEGEGFRKGHAYRWMAADL